LDAVTVTGTGKLRAPEVGVAVAGVGGAMIAIKLIASSVMGARARVRFDA
jgi:hypothetical protein